MHLASLLSSTSLSLCFLLLFFSLLFFSFSFWIHIYRVIITVASPTSTSCLQIKGGVKKRRGKKKNRKRNKEYKK